MARIIRSSRAPRSVGSMRVRLRITTARRWRMAWEKATPTAVAAPA